MCKSFFASGRAVPVLLIGLCGVMAGCDPSTADAGADGGSQGRDAALVAPGIDTWPIDDQTGRVRQVTKYEQAAEADPSLVLMSDLPGAQMPPWDIDPIGVKRVSASRVEALIDSGRWAMVDVRKDRDVAEKGTIPGAYHLEYKYRGARYDGQTRLTRDAVDALLDGYEGIILFCNGPKCPRSFNGSVHMVQDLGVEGSRIRWFRTGVPSWTRSPLIPVANEININPDPGVD
jgi:Rhodanese-like domain